MCTSLLRKIKKIKKEHTGLTFKVEERLEKYTFTRKKEVPKPPKRWEISTRPQDLTYQKKALFIQGGSNIAGTDLYVNKPHCAAAVRP